MKKKTRSQNPSGMKLVNLTPHPVTLVRDGKAIARIAPEAEPARVTTATEQVGAVDVNGFSFPVSKVGLGEAQGIPAPEAGTMYIVSRVE